MFYVIFMVFSALLIQFLSIDVKDSIIKMTEWKYRNVLYFQRLFSMYD